MTKADFEHMIAAYGANPARWPSEQANSARLFMEKFPDQAQKLMSTDAYLDDALNLMSTPSPSDLLKKRILNAASSKAANENVPLPRPRLLHWRSAAALMLGAFALGFGGANWIPSSEPSSETLYAEADTSWAETADDLGLLETYTWVEEDTNF